MDTILEVSSDSVDPARFLLSVCRQILTVGFVRFLSPICWHRMSTRLCQISRTF